MTQPWLRWGLRQAFLHQSVAERALKTNQTIQLLVQTMKWRLLLPLRGGSRLVRRILHIARMTQPWLRWGLRQAFLHQSVAERALKTNHSPQQLRRKRPRTAILLVAGTPAHGQRNAVGVSAINAPTAKHLRLRQGAASLGVAGTLAHGQRNVVGLRAINAPTAKHFSLRQNLRRLGRGA